MLPTLLCRYFKSLFQNLRVIRFLTGRPFKLYKEKKSSKILIDNFQQASTAKLASQICSINIPVEANSTNLYTTYSFKGRGEQCLINAYHKAFSKA